MGRMIPFQIPRRSSVCCRGNERLLPGMEVVSLVSQSDTDALFRRDFCSACWEQEFATKAEAESQSYWRSRIVAQKKPPENSKAKALHLLRQLMNEEGANDKEIYVLALYLQHGRKLILRQEIEDQRGRFGLFEWVETEEFFTIKIVSLSDEEISSTQKFIAERLQGL